LKPIYLHNNIFILLSIKTRIETPIKAFMFRRGTLIFLSYYPLKQGLKRNPKGFPGLYQIIIFILLSIKTRIETPSSNWNLRDE